MALSTLAHLPQQLARALLHDAPGRSVAITGQRIDVRHSGRAATPRRGRALFARHCLGAQGAPLEPSGLARTGGFRRFAVPRARTINPSPRTRAPVLQSIASFDRKRLAKKS